MNVVQGLLFPSVEVLYRRHWVGMLDVAVEEVLVLLDDRGPFHSFPHWLR